MPLDFFSKTPLPDALPEEMGNIIDELKKTSSQEDCLRRAYGILTTKYRGYRLRTYTKLFNLFERDVIAMWGKSGFLHCTSINYLMRILLIRSGWFKEDDIRLVWTQVRYLSPHQYLQIKVAEEWIDVDIWGKVYGIKFGAHAHGFH